ncbi:MAG TPA: tetratricopeptide repeat protein [Chthonomonadales bacterium]|nr:tetratricopeptide repeat protein [Chthonomonadales bacterium]
MGRQKELREIRSFIASARLLTLTGSGGCGKTRLALQAADDVLEQYPDGVWYVELAPLSDPSLMVQSVSSVLGLKEEAGKPALQAVTTHLQSKRLMLLLDNCEHLLAPAARFAADVLSICPDVTVVATSREPLGISGELTYRVPSLAAPEPRISHSPDELVRFEAVQLFVDRARFIQPGFELTDSNARPLTAICHRLDGIPLAIELAAARVRAMSVEQIEERLGQRFRLLTGGSRSSLPRQQTLRSLIDWSYDLLSDEEKALLMRLSVFTGGCTLEAAERVCSGGLVESRQVLDLLTALSDKSMVVYHDHPARYRLLETVRQYGWDRLVEDGSADTFRERHLEYIVELVGDTTLVAGPGHRAWLDALDAEHDNLRSALDWIAARDVQRALKLAAAAWRFWNVRGYLSEGRSRLESLLEAPAAKNRTSERAKALSGAGNLACTQGDYDVARARHLESLEIQTELGDRHGMAHALNNLGSVAYDVGDYAAARAHYQGGLEIRRAMGDRHGVAQSLNNLGVLANVLGDYDAAEALYQESLEILREIGDQWGVAKSLNNLGAVAFNQADYNKSQSLHSEGLAIRRQLGDRWGIATSLHNLSEVNSQQGDYSGARAMIRESLGIRRGLGDRRGTAKSLEALALVDIGMGNVLGAARAWGAAARIREELGSPHVPVEQQRYKHTVEEARASVDDATLFDAAWQMGRDTPVEDVLDLVLKDLAV